MQGLIEQGIPIQYVEMFDQSNHLPSMMIGGRGVFSTLQIAQALVAANLHVGTDPNQAELYLHDGEEE